MQEDLLGGVQRIQLSGRRKRLVVDAKSGGEQQQGWIRVIRTKPTKEQSMPCPFSLPVIGHDDLVSSIKHTFRGRQSIQGYDWDSLDPSGYVEEQIELEETVEDGESSTARTMDRNDSEVETEREEESVSLSPLVVDMKNLDIGNGRGCSNQAGQFSSSSNDDSSSCSSSSSSNSSFSSSSTSTSTTSDHSAATSDSYASSTSSSCCSKWKTAKSIRTSKLPKKLLFHLKRFDYEHEQGKLLSKPLRIPYEMDIRNYIDDENEDDSTPSLRYLLSGAIVHVEDAGVDQSASDTSVGHYITYLAIGQEGKSDETTANGDLWVKIDDSKVTPFIVTSLAQRTEPMEGNTTQYRLVPREKLLQLFGCHLKNNHGLIPTHCATVLLFQQDPS